jgi:hypothetical protein
MTLSSFLTFLTFLAQKLPFSAPASDPWQGPEIPSCPRRECLGPPQTVRPEGDALTGQPEFASGYTMVPLWRLPDPRSHKLHGGIRYTAGVDRFEDGRLAAEIFLNAAKHGPAVDVNVCDAAVAASLLLPHGCQVAPQQAGAWARGWAKSARDMAIGPDKRASR